MNSCGFRAQQGWPSAQKKEKKALASDSFNPVFARQGKSHTPPFHGCSQAVGRVCRVFKYEVN
jgi:hypothetical protein